jgi:hypothetical protein
MSQRMKLFAGDKASAGTSPSARRAHAALRIREGGGLRTPPRGVKKTPSASVYLTSSRDASRFSVLHLDGRSSSSSLSLAIGLNARRRTKRTNGRRGRESWRRSGRKNGRTGANARENGFVYWPVHGGRKAYGVGHRSTLTLRPMQSGHAQVIDARNQ